jgi:putative ABC transport system permease protein
MARSRRGRPGADPELYYFLKKGFSAYHFESKTLISRQRTHPRPLVRGLRGRDPPPNPAGDPAMSARVPVAWLQLVQAKGRLIAAVAGIAFTVTFSLVQLAFQDALYASVTLLYSHLKADLILVSPRYQCIVSTENFPEARLYQALAFDPVESVASLYMSMAQWKNPLDRHERQIFVVGFKPRPGVFDLPGVERNLQQIAEPGKVLFDEGSRPEFGPVSDWVQKQGSVTTELSHRRVEVVGLFRIGANFANDGNVITSDTNFLEIVPYRKLGIVDVGLIQLKPGADAEATRAQLEAALPDDVIVLTRQAFLDREKRFFASSLPVGLFFLTSVLMGLIVGAVIVYQILYSDVSEHLSEYATVKALGYSDRYLFRVVLEEALILSLLGFPPGVLLSLGVYQIARMATMLPIAMTLSRIVVVYFLTLAMCGLAGVLAMRRLQYADPADIF